MIAAATTSLPETPGGERNWDYRYSWIRDSTFMLWGLYTLGFDWEANDFFYFIADVAEDEEGRAADHVRHRRRERAHRADARPPLGLRRRAARARSATAPTTSTSTTSGARSSTRSTCTPGRATSLPERIWPIVKRQVEAALEHWREPDRGIWEVRGEPQHFTSSKVMCWVAADRGARLARAARGPRARRRAGSRRPTRSTPTSARTRVDERGVFTPALRHRRARRVGAADAARALPARRRSAHPRHRAGDRRRADRGRAGAALPRRGDRRRARAARRARSRSARSGWSRRCARSARSSAGAAAVREAALLRQPARSSTPRRSTRSTGRHLGNFPQAFTHLALINAVMHVIRADQQVEMRRVLARARAERLRMGTEPERVRAWTPCGWRRSRVRFCTPPHHPGGHVAHQRSADSERRRAARHLSAGVELHRRRDDLPAGQLAARGAAASTSTSSTGSWATGGPSPGST